MRKKGKHGHRHAGFGSYKNASIRLLRDFVQLYPDKIENLKRTAFKSKRYSYILGNIEKTLELSMGNNVCEELTTECPNNYIKRFDKLKEYFGEQAYEDDIANILSKSTKDIVFITYPNRTRMAPSAMKDIYQHRLSAESTEGSNTQANPSKIVGFILQWKNNNTYTYWRSERGNWHAYQDSKEKIAKNVYDIFTKDPSTNAPSEFWRVTTILTASQKAIKTINDKHKDAVVL